MLKAKKQTRYIAIFTKFKPDILGYTETITCMVMCSNDNISPYNVKNLFKYQAMKIKYYSSQWNILLMVFLTLFTKCSIKNSIHIHIYLYLSIQCSYQSELTIELIFHKQLFLMKLDFKCHVSTKHQVGGMSRNLASFASLFIRVFETLFHNVRIFGVIFNKAPILQKLFG